MKIKRFLQITNKVDEALDESIDIFLSQRPFLENVMLDAEIQNIRTDAEIERKIDNEVLIEKLRDEFTKYV